MYFYVSPQPLLLVPIKQISTQQKKLEANSAKMIALYSHAI
jgi:hypothetical protein